MSARDRPEFGEPRRSPLEFAIIVYRPVDASASSLCVTLLARRSMGRPFRRVEHTCGSIIHAELVTRVISHYRNDDLNARDIA